MPSTPSRRGFFKQFVGQMGVLRDEFRGVECIPLNRLNELPDKFIEQIEPVFFPEAKWEIREDTLYSWTGHNIDCQCFKLNEEEMRSMELFTQHLKIEEVAGEISREFNFPYPQGFQAVSFLFFRLASLRICHPRQVFQIDQIKRKYKE